MKYIAAKLTDKGKERDENQDSFLVLPERNIFAVFDGVGGAARGDIASKTAMTVLEENLLIPTTIHNKVPSLDEHIHRICLALEEAHQAVLKKGPAGMATTAAVLMFWQEWAIVAHVGDSRIYRYRNNDFIRLTQDHQNEGGELTGALGFRIIDDLAIFWLHPEDTFLLCTDGVTNHLRDLELANILKESDTLELACQQIKKECYARGALDNLTVVVVKCVDDVEVINLSSETTEIDEINH